MDDMDARAHPTPPAQPLPAARDLSRSCAGPPPPGGPKPSPAPPCALSPLPAVAPRLSGTPAEEIRGLKKKGRVRTGLEGGAGRAGAATAHEFARTCTISGGAHLYPDDRRPRIHNLTQL